MKKIKIYQKEEHYNFEVGYFCKRKQKYRITMLQFLRTYGAFSKDGGGFEKKENQ
jgi:hypothetical protein